jgi:glucose-6-phosphate dehydrogenase assembly protein OpcA
MSSGPIPAQPEKILRELGRVWTSLGEEERHQGKPTVLRACAMTLIVITDEEDEESASASQTLVELMHAHPSRAIVLRSDPKAESGLSARVFAQCWKPFGKAQQICCEQIEVSARPDRLIDAGPTVLGIVVPDLPVVVWCRMKSALRTLPKDQTSASMDPVLALATKIIVDTNDADLNQAFDVLRGWRSAGRMIGDLEWTRITPWRETIGTAFEENANWLQPAGLTAEVTYSGAAVPASALYLAAWLERGTQTKASLRREDSPWPGLISVRFSGEHTVELSRTGPTCLKLRVGEQEQQVSLAGSSFYELMHEELTVLGYDPVFNAAFDRAEASYRQ